MQPTTRQRQALEILAQAERPLRQKDFHETFEVDGRRTSGWAKALGPLSKPRNHHPTSLLAQGIVEIVDKRFYILTDHGRKVAKSLGIQPIGVITPSPVTPPSEKVNTDTVDANVATDDAVLHERDPASIALSIDLKSILADPKIDLTAKASLIKARVGQGKFRTRVLQLWDKCCSVTGSSMLEAIRASHIKPWRESSNEERLDPNNGLPLIASLDALFDAGLISFDSTGTLIVSLELNASEQKLFEVADRSLRKKPSGKTARYLEYHRKHVFRK